MVEPHSDAALGQRRVHNARSTSLNGIVPTATLTSLIHCTVHCPIPAAVAVCHMTNHTHTDTEQRVRAVLFQPICVVFFKAHTRIMKFRPLIGDIVPIYTVFTNPKYLICIDFRQGGPLQLLTDKQTTY